MSWFNFKTTEKEDKSDLVLYAPITGTTVSLEDIPDVVFSEKIVGDGIAIKPSGDKIVAPCNCTISEIFKTKQAVVLQTTPYELTLFIHIGIDIIDSGGNDIFTLAVQEGDCVKTGDTLIDFNLPLLQSNVKSTITPIIISATCLDRVDRIEKADSRCIAGNSPILKIYMRK